MGKKRSRTIAPLPHLPRYIQCKVALLWVKRSTPLYGLLSTNVLREVSQFFALRPMIIGVFSLEQLTVFDVLAKRLRNIDCKKIPQESTEYVFIDDDQLFLCGGIMKIRVLRCAATAFVLDCNHLKRLSSMRLGRFSHGLYYHEESRSVFAFGGFYGQAKLTTNCEQYEITTNSWSPLPNMVEANRNISTCGYRGKVYISGGYSATIEIFTIASKEFTVAPVLIESIGNPYTHVVWDNKLIVFYEGNVRMFDIDSFALVRQLAVPFLPLTASTLLVNDTLFSLSYGQCISFDIQTMAAGPTYTIR